MADARKPSTPSSTSLPAGEGSPVLLSWAPHVKVYEEDVETWLVSGSQSVQRSRLSDRFHMKHRLLAPLNTWRVGGSPAALHPTKISSSGKVATIEAWDRSSALCQRLQPSFIPLLGTTHLASGSV